MEPRANPTLSKARLQKAGATSNALDEILPGMELVVPRPWYQHHSIYVNNGEIEGLVP
jgi:hypothetical protein